VTPPWTEFQRSNLDSRGSTPCSLYQADDESPLMNVFLPNRQKVASVRSTKTTSSLLCMIHYNLNLRAPWPKRSSSGKPKQWLWACLRIQRNHHHHKTAHHCVLSGTSLIHFASPQHNESTSVCLLDSLLSTDPVSVTWTPCPSYISRMRGNLQGA
jgi:hypothetical protein